MKNWMKNIISAAFMALVLVACNTPKTSYTINGVVEDMEDGTLIKLTNAQTYTTIDSTTVRNGKFTFTGSVKQPILANFYFGNMFHAMVLENANYQVSKGKYYSYVDGGEINNLVYGYTLESAYQTIRKEHALAQDPFKGIDMMDKEALEKARKISGSRMRKERDYSKAYQRGILKGDHSTLVKLFTLSQIQDWDNYNWNKKLELFNEYEKDLGPHPLLVKERESLKRAIKAEEIRKAVGPGKPYKEVVGQHKDGHELKLSDVVKNNKYTLLEMWASWCGPCRGEFPHLKKAYKHYHEKGFEIFALSIDEREQDWLKALNEENVPWINVIDFKGREGAGPKAYAVSGIPASFLIDQNGTIVAVGMEVRGFALDEKLEELLGK